VNKLELKLSHFRIYPLLVHVHYEYLQHGGVVVNNVTAPHVKWMCYLDSTTKFYK